MRGLSQSLMFKGCTDRRDRGIAKGRLTSVTRPHVSTLKRSLNLTKYLYVLVSILNK